MLFEVAVENKASPGLSLYSNYKESVNLLQRKLRR